MIILSYDCIFRFLLSRPNGNMSGCERRYARLHAMIFRLQPDSDVTGENRRCDYAAVCGRVVEVDAWV